MTSLSPSDEGYDPRFDAGGIARGPLPPSLPDHVLQQIEREIIELRIQPGEHVSSEQLAARMGLSRSPVREALRVLEARGLIVLKRGRGAHVARRSTHSEACALYELRAPIESYLAGRAAESMTAEDLEQIQSIHARFVKEAQRKRKVSLKTLIDLDSDLHWTIYNGADSDLASIVASYWARLQRELYDRAYRSDNPRHFGAQHTEIIDALRSHDADRAAAAMHRHIEAGWEAVGDALSADEPDRG